MIEGTIIKGVGGLYTVATARGFYQCSARGVFRNRQVTPLIGDRVQVQVIDETERTGMLYAIFPRSNELPRPKVANVDQVVITLAAAQPALNTTMLDRYLLLAEYEKVPAVLCINKMDLSAPGQLDELIVLYQQVGYPVVCTAAQQDEGIATLKAMMRGKITVFAGPSGVGKSSLINRLSPGAQLATNGLSAKIDRGKHTTRHAEIFIIHDENRAAPSIMLMGEDDDAESPYGFVIDTPGFTSLDLSFIPLARRATLFREFLPFMAQCRFADCKHDKETDCAVKAQVGHAIHPWRYASYLAVLR